MGMAQQEKIRRELAADVADFEPINVDTAKAGPNMDNIGAFLVALANAPPLDPQVNEVLLFHGTNPIAADKIAATNFRVNLAGSNAGALYGRGLYLAENV